LPWAEFEGILNLPVLLFRALHFLVSPPRHRVRISALLICVGPTSCN
jgi:hypothetical protein